MKIILGSQSLARKKILESMGYQFEVMPANIDEKAIRLEDPVELTRVLANAKADALLSRVGKNAILITSDQVVVCNGTILEKPTSAEEAKRFILLHNKYPAETVTSVVVVNTSTKKRFTGTDIAKIWFGNISEGVIDDYIASGDPFLHSGGFDHEHPLILPYVLRIEGEPESISGLPVGLTEGMIKLSFAEYCENLKNIVDDDDNCGLLRTKK